jgi:hypothetical protein
VTVSNGRVLKYIQPGPVPEITAKLPYKANISFALCERPLRQLQRSRRVSPLNLRLRPVWVGSGPMAFKRQSGSYPSDSGPISGCTVAPRGSISQPGRRVRMTLSRQLHRRQTEWDAADAQGPLKSLVKRGWMPWAARSASISASLGPARKRLAASSTFSSNTVSPTVLRNIPSLLST